MLFRSKEISLCEAGVGTGKTLAYLVGCILWQMHRPERMKLPSVISTSSVALQDAILTEYLPDLSAVLLGEGIIREPITAVVRKGKERFVCDARLAERASLVQPSRKRQTNSLNIAAHILDMDHIPELSRYDRCRICVPQSCPRDCFLREDCRYQQYLRDSMKPDIQICNHNYILKKTCRIAFKAGHSERYHFMHFKLPQKNLLNRRGGCNPIRSNTAFDL